MLSFLVTSGFLPVLIFLAADTVAPKRVALWTALAATGGALLIALARGTMDSAGLASFALLAGLVAASMRARDDFWFKIHGALLGLLIAAVFFAAWFILHKALLLEPPVRDGLLDMVASGNPGMTRDGAREVLRLMSMLLPWAMLLHALATIHAAANWGKWAWALVRVPGFFAASTFAYFAALAAAR